MNAQRFLVECWLGFKASSTHACMAESIWKCFKREVDAVLAIWMKTDHCIRTEASSLEIRSSHQQFEQIHHWYECFILWGLSNFFLIWFTFYGFRKTLNKIEKKCPRACCKEGTRMLYVYIYGLDDGFIWNYMQMRTQQCSYCANNKLLQRKSSSQVL